MGDGEAREVTPDRLVGALPPAERLLVVIDFDGVLSEIVDEPDAAAPVDGAEDALRTLATSCPVAIVSGRPVADLHRRLDPALPVVFAGSHGAELARTDGTIEALSDPAAVAATLDTVEDELATLLESDAGWYLERKPTSIAVHHRRVADPGATLEEVRRRLASHRDDPPGFEVLDGKAVTELRPAGVDKGGVVDLLVEREPGRHLLVFGDDVTDEDAFRAARAHGGTTVLVAGAPRPTAAEWRIDRPQEVVAVLALLAGTT